MQRITMQRNKSIFLMGLLVAILLLLMALGLKGWNALVVPNLGKISQFSLPILLGFAFLAGMVTFFAPCAFPLFPGYVAFYLGAEEKERVHPALLGIMASLGIVTFFLILSIVFVLVGKGITPYLKYIAPTLGLVVLLLGVLLASGYAFKTGKIQQVLDRWRSKEKRSKRNIYLFGLGYGAVSLGCTLPLLFTMIVVPLTTGKAWNVFLSLLVYALAMSLLMMLLTYAVAWSEDTLIKKLVGSTGTIKKWSGIVLIIVGAYLLYYNIFYNML